ARSQYLRGQLVGLNRERTLFISRYIEEGFAFKKDGSFMIVKNGGKSQLTVRFQCNNAPVGQRKFLRPRSGIEHLLPSRNINGLFNQVVFLDLFRYEQVQGCKRHNQQRSRDTYRLPEN